MEFPSQQSGVGPRRLQCNNGAGSYDMRNDLNPRRLTLVMWDNAFLLRHGPGGSFEDYDKVLDEALERGYNTLRLDPMPQWVDLSKPERMLEWADPKLPYMPWNWNSAVSGPVGKWLIEFIEKLCQRKLNYTLSAWWFDNTGAFKGGPPLLHRPTTHVEAAEVWAGMLGQWKQRFGFDGLVYVDVANEVPFFLPGFMESFIRETDGDWSVPQFTPRQIEFLSQDMNSALAMLQREFLELRFTTSIHGDVRWLDVPIDFDCLDVHFYSEADARWGVRTRFVDFMKDMFTDASWHAEFSDRCTKTNSAVAPMLRARQRNKLAQFSGWAAERGMPLTTSESWASWYYFDSPELDWRWLLEWAEWSVEDAIEFGMWGWTPHNYCQPQFENWKDVKWHQRLTSEFLRSK